MSSLQSCGIDETLPGRRHAASLLVNLHFDLDNLGLAHSNDCYGFMGFPLLRVRPLLGICREFLHYNNTGHNLSSVGA